MMHHPTQGPRFCAALAVPLLLASCSQGPERTVDESRTLPADQVDLQWNRSHTQRFSRDQAPPPTGLELTLPEGWESRVSNQPFRKFTVGVIGQPDTECYLSFLSGSGGGALMNINRWRGQVGLGPLDQAAFDAVARHPFLGSSAPFAELTDGPGDDGMLVLFNVLPEGFYSLKMLGPKGVLARESERFLAFGASLDLDGGPGAAGRADPKVPDATGGPGGSFRDGARKLGWEIPKGWSLQPARSNRLATFSIGDGAECAVSAWPGDLGGLRANVDRWRGQVGLPAVAAGGDPDLERMRVLGSEAVLVDLEGPEGDGMLALYLLLAEESLFVKLTGPVALLASERDHFRAFCASLREEKP